MIKMNKNIYYANVALVQCETCGGEAIISIERAKKKHGTESLFCPYCGARSMVIKAQTTDDTRQEYEFGAFTLTEKD